MTTTEFTTDDAGSYRTSTAGARSRPGIDEPLRIVPLRSPGQWVAAAVALFLLVFAVDSLAHNKAIEWHVVGEYFTSHAIVSGLYMTLWLTGLTLVLGFALGIVVAIMRMSHNAVLQGLAWGYIWIFRATPLLVQLLLWFNLGALYPKLSLGIPWGPTYLHVETKNLVGATAAAIIGLTLHEAAYAAEIIRGGILSVDTGQSEAAQALGLSRARILRRIVLPQAMRTIIPSAGNLLIGLLKRTTMVSVIAVNDLLYSAQLIYNRNFLIIPLLTVATLWYIVITSILTTGQYYLERYFGQGSARQPPPTPLQRLRTRIASPHPRVGGTA